MTPTTISVAALTEKSLRRDAVLLADQLKRGKNETDAGRIDAQLMMYQPRPRPTPDFCCPYCFLSKGLNVVMTCREGSDEHDVLGCHACHSDFVVFT